MLAPARPEMAQIGMVGQSGDVAVGLAKVGLCTFFAPREKIKSTCVWAIAINWLLVASKLSNFKTLR